MAKRPPGIDRRTWLEQRARVWRRRNRVLNALMIAVTLAILVRYCTQTG